MTPVQFARYVRYKTRTNATTFTDDDILLLMSQRQDEIAEAALKADEDIFLIPETVGLVANQREYPLDPDIISRIKRVDAKLDGSNWIPLTEVDITQLNIAIGTETDITSNYSNTKGGAFYDLSRKAITLLSGTITTVAAGLKFWVDIYPAPITDLSSNTEMAVDPTSTSHGMPRPLHKVWATGVIIDYKQSREKPIPLTEEEQNYEMKLQRAIETLMHGNMDREVIAYVPYDDGSQY